MRKILLIFCLLSASALVASSVPECYPHDTIRDITAFTVKARVRIDSAQMPEKESFQFLRQVVGKTGWALELKNFGARGTMVQLGCNGAWFTAGWIRPNAGTEHEIVLTARKGLLVLYRDGEILRRFNMLVTPNLEPIRVWKKGGVEVLSVEFLGAEHPYYAKGETDEPAEGFVGGVGWLVSCPPEKPGVKLPRILCFGDSVLSGYAKHLRRELEGKAYVYTWGWYVEQPLGDKVPREKFIAATKVKPFDCIVFNNGLHSLHWTPEKVSDELVMSTQRAILNSFREGGPQAKVFWMSTTPHTSRKLNAAHKVDALGELNPMVERINRLTARVMEAEGVPTIDAYGLLSQHLDLAAGDAYHWTADGYTLLARLMAERILGRP